MSRLSGQGALWCIALMTACGPTETTLFDEHNPPLTPKGTECALDPDCGAFTWRPQWFSTMATFAVDPTGSTLRSYRENGQVVLPSSSGWGWTSSTSVAW